MKRLIFSLLSLAVLSSAPSRAAQPMDELRKAIDQVLVILEDPSYSVQSQKASAQEKIWAVFRQMFDLEEMAKRTLAGEWSSFTVPQRAEFSEVFGEFLGKNYLNKIQSDFKGEKVKYLDQEMTGDDRAYIRTMILRKEVEIPVDYSMLKSNDHWKVYDVKVEGVSLLKNYREQFKAILLKGSPAQLIDQIKKKLKEQD